ncbi:MAG: glycosyltransferase [Mogibacterium sp.]|nr:glycosyltransferase [Mogibacterium sp.]
MSDHHNICLLNDSFLPIIDGVANAVVNYAKNIERSHGHSLVVTPDVPGADDSGYPFPVIRYPSIDVRKQLGYVAGYPFSPEAAYRIRAEKAELLHIHCPIMSALLARQLRESLQLPLVLTWHTKYDIDIANAIHSKLLQKGATQALMNNVNACDEVWTVSEGAGDNLRSLGYEGDIIVMPNGVDLPRGRVSDEAVQEAVREYDLPEGVPVFLFVGRLMWYKGLRIILDGLKALADEGIDHRMVFIGSGTDADEVQAYSRELGLGSSCVFTGAIRERDTLRAWYTRADLLLFPSTFDTNGLVVREAAACDLATVMIAGSCASEGVTDGRNGFFIEENADSMAAMLRKLCAEPQRMRQVGETAGRELYLSWENAVANACERYEIVIDNYRSGRYPVRRSVLEEGFMKSQGDLMEAFGSAGAAGRELQQGLREFRQDALDEMDAFRVDLISSVEAARDDLMRGIQAQKEQFRSDLNDLQEGFRAAAAKAEAKREKREKEIWDYLERYM